MKRQGCLEDASYRVLTTLLAFGQTRGQPAQAKKVCPRYVRLRAARAYVYLRIELTFERYVVLRIKFHTLSAIIICFQEVDLNLTARATVYCKN